MLTQRTKLGEGAKALDSKKTDELFGVFGLKNKAKTKRWINSLYLKGNSILNGSNNPIISTVSNTVRVINSVDSSLHRQIGNSSEDNSLISPSQGSVGRFIIYALNCFTLSYFSIHPGPRAASLACFQNEMY